MLKNAHSNSHATALARSVLPDNESGSEEEEEVREGGDARIREKALPFLS